jgi:hypothetical protein
LQPAFFFFALPEGLSIFSYQKHPQFMSASKKVYALLVGINAYPAPVPPLSGCKNDVKAIQTYLEQEKGIELELKVLLDEKATKAAIVEQFEQHLGQAGPEDTALFYYSGHGAMEAAPEVFRQARADERLQALVCVDSIVEKDGASTYNLLADKELRYLLHQLSKKNPHIVTIFDCCHSGDNTRSVNEVPRQVFFSRNLEEPFPERSWGQFIFSEDLTVEALSETSIRTLLPEGRHIQLAACLPEQRAYEKGGKGIFTKHLIEVLNSAEGAISYFDLISAIRIKLREKANQKPVVYVPQTAQDEVYAPLWGRDEGALYTPEEGWLTVIQSNGEWIASGGAMEGVTRQGQAVQVFSLDGQQQYTATITKIEQNFSVLSFEKEPPGSGPYRIALKALRVSAVPLYLKGEVTETIRTQLAEETDVLELVGEESAAYCTAHFKPNRIDLTFANDPTRPIVSPLPGREPSDIKRLISYLEHIGAWRFLLQMQNPQSVLRNQQPIKAAVFEIEQNGEEHPVTLVEDHIPLTVEETKSGTFEGKFKMQLTNTGDRPLYLGMLYMTINFMVYPKMLEPPVVCLQPKTSIWVYGNDPIELELEEQVLKYNWPTSTTYFLLFVSMNNFDIGVFEQGSLPSPLEGITRFGRAIRKKQIKNDDWYTRLFTLALPNPRYVAES